MSAFVKHNVFAANIGNGVYNLNSDTIKVALTNADPAATDSYSSLASEVANGNGYTTGGLAFTSTGYTQTSGTATLAATGPTLTALGAVGPFRYAYAYDSTISGKNVIGHWDYGSSITMANGDTVALTPTGSAIFTLA